MSNKKYYVIREIEAPSKELANCFANNSIVKTKVLTKKELSKKVSKILKD